MKISGFTIVRNAISNDYPIVEAIRSILPLVDEMIVLVGDSEDDTLGLIRSIGDAKIRIHQSIWDPGLRTGGAVLAVETDNALALVDPASTWAFYIQADEVVHEQDHAAIREACVRYGDDPRVQGLLFNYLHFYGTYDCVGDSRRWYDHEVRIIRARANISAYRDAQGFRIGRTKLRVKPVDACVYHYGWVKTPERMMTKVRNTSRFWHRDATLESLLQGPDDWNFTDIDSLRRFDGTHPAVMGERIARHSSPAVVEIDRKRFSLSEQLLYHFEKATGIRPFAFTNYRLLK